MANYQVRNNMSCDINGTAVLK